MRLVLMVAGCLLVVAAAYPASLAPPRDKQLDPDLDPRLRVQVSVMAHHTTVGRVLAELSRKTGVRLQPGTAAERDEPIFVAWKNRPLYDALSLLAEEFRWDQDRGRGWFWLRSTGDRPAYALHRDLATQRLVDERRRTERERFAADLEQRIRKFKGRDPRGMQSLEAVAYLPSAMWRGALSGKTQVIYPPRLSAGASRDSQANVG